MTPCRAVVLLFFAPLVIGALIGVAVANTWLTALEDRERERREAERDARHMEIDICHIPADYSFEVN